MMGKRVDSPDAEHSFERFVNSRPASDDDLLTSRQAGDSSPNTEGGVGTWAKDDAHLSMNDAIIMKKPLLVALTLSVFALVGQAAVNVPLTIQEAIYPGSIAGISRTADPVTVGIPLPDDPTNGATDISELTLTGAATGQFRVLGRWPSGRIKWVLVDTQANVNAGGVTTSIVLTTVGPGNFGGANLATDNGSTITVATGTATFTVKKANFNVFDVVDVGSTHVVLTGASDGLVIAGPANPGTSCGTCTTLYKSSN